MTSRLAKRFKQENAADTVPRSSGGTGRKSRETTPHAVGGNHSILRKIESGQLQVSQPDDKYEREADRVAQQVMRMPDQDSLGLRPESGIGTRIQGMCPRCQKRSMRSKWLNCKDCEEDLQRKEDGSRVPSVEDKPESEIRSLSSGGQPLPESVRAFFEPRFGTDFSSVRIHTDNKAAQSCKDLNSKAYTIGNDMFFAIGGYAPNTTKGRKLIAHELTHVVQRKEDGPSNSKLEILRAPETSKSNGIDFTEIHDLLEDILDLVNFAGPCTAQAFFLSSAITSAVVTCLASGVPTPTEIIEIPGCVLSILGVVASGFFYLACLKAELDRRRRERERREKLEELEDRVEKLEEKLSKLKVITDSLQGAPKKVPQRTTPRGISVA